MSKPPTDTTSPDVLPLKVAPRHHEILNVLSLLGYGEMLDALGDDMRELEKAISETGKAGELTLKIKVAPNGHNKRMLTYDLKVKKPTVPGCSTYVFASQAGQYVENDPDQKELPLNVTAITEKPVRVVGGH